MPRQRADVVSALEKKGFRKKPGGDHDYYSYWNISGKKTSIYTKVSRGTNYKTLSDSLIGKMARQTQLAKNKFLELVDCTLSQELYEKHITKDE